MGFQKEEYLRALVQRTKRLVGTHEVILLTSNKEWTNNQDDYSGYSVKSEFFSDDDEEKILNTLYKIGFAVRQFCNEEDFLAFVSTEQQSLSNKIVVNSAQKGTKIGRKSLIPAVCDLYGIPYVGSDPYVVSLCRDKYRCSCILAQNGIPVPGAWLYQPIGAWIHEPPVNAGELIAKPNYEAASIGIDESNVCTESTIYKKAQQLESVYHHEKLAEKFISGYEVEVPVIVSGNVPTVFFPVGISLGGPRKMGKRILNYHLRSMDAYEYYNFSLENPQAAKAALDAAYKTAKILNIKGFGRVDLRISESGNVYVTDIATNPHYTTGSSYEFLFSQLGFHYDDLVACLIASSIGEGT